MTKKTTEESFLNDRIGTFVSVYLITGIRLTGTLQDHDSDAVFLCPRGGRPSQIQMIFKLAISTIEADSSIDARHSPDDLGGMLSRTSPRGRT